MRVGTSLLDDSLLHIPDVMIKRLTYMYGNNVSVSFAENYVTILHGIKVVDRFSMGESTWLKVYSICREVGKIANKRYLLKSVLRKRLKQVRYQPIF